MIFLFYKISLTEISVPVRVAASSVPPTASCGRIIILNQTALWDTCVVKKPTQQNQTKQKDPSGFGEEQAGQVSDLRLYCNWFVSDFIQFFQSLRLVIISSLQNGELQTSSSLKTTEEFYNSMAQNYVLLKGFLVCSVAMWLWYVSHFH